MPSESTARGISTEQILFSQRPMDRNFRITPNSLSGRAHGSRSGIPEQRLPQTVRLRQSSDDDRGRNWPPHTRYRSWLPCFKNAWCKGTRPACPYLRQNRLLCGQKAQNHSDLLGPSPSRKFSTIPATLPSHHVNHQWWPVDHFPIGTGSSPHGSRVSPSTSQHKHHNSPSRQRCNQ